MKNLFLLVVKYLHDSLRSFFSRNKKTKNKISLEQEVLKNINEWCNYQESYFKSCIFLF